MKKYGFGVDIGGTTIKMSLFEMTGHMVDKWEIPTNTSDHGSSILDDVAAVIEGRLVSDGISKEDVEGIGIGVPGPVVEDSVVVCCVNLGWGRVDVAKELSEKTGLKVRVGNDANVAALGEMWQGGGKGYKNVIMITLGTGVGGGIIIDGKIINGSNGAGGEIGHVFVDEAEEEKCGCGKCGCLEQYASATGIVRLAKRALAADGRDSALRSVENLSAKAVADAGGFGKNGQDSWDSACQCSLYRRPGSVCYRRRRVQGRYNNYRSDPQILHRACVPVMQKCGFCTGAAWQ